MASPARTLDALSDAIKGDVNRIPDPGAGGTLTSLFTPATCELVSVSGGNRTLASPRYAGMALMISMKSADGGSVTVTSATLLNAASNNIMTFTAAGDYVALRSIQVGTDYLWRVVANNGASLS